jgi:hypothetical protein
MVDLLIGLEVLNVDHNQRWPALGVADHAGVPMSSCYNASHDCIGTLGRAGDQEPARCLGVGQKMALPVRLTL